MITVRHSADRGHADHGWLDTRHTFSFADYYDPRFMGFRSLRVINEDRVKPGQGFGTHPHRDMEILSYVLEGEIAHKDSTGTGATLKPGEVQRMTAGTGVLHSEFNPSKSSPLHFLQIWIVPARQGLAPSYEQKPLVSDAQKDRWILIASPDARDGSVTVHQDVNVYAARLSSGQKLAHAFRPGRHGWLQVARGEVSLNGEALKAGDGAALSDEQQAALEAKTDAEVLLFDLA